MVESCLAIFVLCLILFGILQVSYLVMSKDVVSFAAFAGARAATVGMNDDFVERVVRVASIPTAGPMLGFTEGSAAELGEGRAGVMWDRALNNGPSSSQYWVEKYWIPRYLGAEDEADLDGILNYYNWLEMDTRIAVEYPPQPGDEYAEVPVKQYVPLAFPFSGLFYRGNSGQMIRPAPGGRQQFDVYRLLLDDYVMMENHSALYMVHE